VKRTKLERALR